MAFQPLSAGGVSMLWPVFTILDALKAILSFVVTRILELIVPIPDDLDETLDAGPTFGQFLLALIFFGLLLGTIYYSSVSREIAIALAVVAGFVYGAGFRKSR